MLTKPVLFRWLELIILLMVFKVSHPCSPDTYRSDPSDQYSACYSCHMLCYQCTGSGADQCISCLAGSSRQIQSGSCVCMDHYGEYDPVGYACQLLTCDASCGTCRHTSTHCTSCDVLSNKILNNFNQCVCRDQQFYSNYMMTCQPCDIRCQTCIGSADNCLTCHSTRQMDPSNLCVCKSGFDQKGTVAQDCRLVCDVTCLTCSLFASNCTSCDTALMRTYNSAANTCQCVAKSYNTGLAHCQACHYSCMACETSGLSDGCTICDPAKNRILDGGVCKCEDKFYDSGTDQEQCSACDAKCVTCQTSSANCVSCHSTREQDPISKMCNCVDMYGENSPITESCRPLTCHHSCKICKNTENFCTSCETADERILDQVLGQCPCNQKLYDSGIALCQNCDYTCKTCSTTATSCTSCNGLKYRVTDNNGNCPCMPKYFDQASNELCSRCDYKCKTCVTSSSNCLTCGDNRNSAPLCACLIGYYDDGSSQDCKICHYSCKSCVNDTSCQSCDDANAFRVFTAVSTFCVCMNRYFEPSGNVTVCQLCHPTCLKCTGSSAANSCTSCLSSANRQLSGSTCVCKTGFYAALATTELCSACDYKCLTCFLEPTNCTTCSSSLFRVISSNSCPCKTGYFESPQTGLCVTCHSSCKTCTNATQCLTCDSAKLRQLNSSNLCSCPSTQYYNTTQIKCVSCSITCKTCTQTSSTTCTSCDTGRTLISAACPCLPFYYSNAAICSSCHYSCLTCSGSLVTQCLTCSSANFRSTTLSAGRCLCQAGYFDNGTAMMCKKCGYQCATCLDATTCQTCDAAVFRELPGSLCPCKSGYYEGSSFTCEKCAYYCLTCTEASICATCNSPNRFLNPLTLKCDCPDRFYDDGSSITCKACLSRCKTCINADICESCEIAEFRSLTPSNKCRCIDKYFDISGVCTSCLTSCATCSEPLKCESCNTTANRELDPVTNQCMCKQGNFDIGVEQCSLCDYSCLECTTSATHCTACVSSRILNNNQCLCKPQFYESKLAACAACEYTCGLCTNATACSTCGADKFRIFDQYNVRCVCLTRYYDDGTNQLCQACSYTCQTCTNGTECHTCDATKFRITPASLCPCITKYYDSGLDSETCLACDYSCQTCNSGTQCQTCDTATNHRTLDPVSKLCRCIDTFYSDGTNELCLACVYSCATCETSSSTCTSCTLSSNRQLSIDSCPCQLRFFDENLDEICQPCQYTCETCSDSLTCDTCDAANFRQHNVTDDLCHCMAGYFDDLTNTQTCQQCHLSCYRCVDSLSCSECDSAKRRILNSSVVFNGSFSLFCVCEHGLYSTGFTETCLQCHYTCDVCSGPSLSNCLFCDSSANRMLKNLNQCHCMNGFYEDSINQLCPPCHEYCSICTGPLNTECNSCKLTKFLLQNETTCYQACPIYYFNNLDLMKCTPCNSNCLRCLNEKTCTQCENGHHLHEGQCYTDCPEKYWENAQTKLCVQCPSVCKTCDSMVKCMTCIQHHYFDLKVEMCFSCHSTCKSCIGSAQDQCLSCYEPLHFKSNKCRNLTCPYGQYVDSVLGCKPCSDLFPNSLTCNKTQAFLCTATFKLKNGECKVCSEVEGYHITASTNTCSEVCGDGKLFDYQCDDGNQLDGDGCSKNCIIEEGWSCRANSSGSASICRLDSALSMTLNKLVKASGKNTVNLYFILSLPLRLINNFTLQASGLQLSDMTWSHIQNSEFFGQVQLTINYTKSLQGKNLQITYDTAAKRRLQENQNFIKASDSFGRLLQQSSSVFLNAEFKLTAFPPVDYYSSTEFQFFESAKTIVYYLALALMAVSLFVFPTKTHLHSFTFSFIVAKVWLMFGLALEEKLDWVNFVLQDIKGFALIGGVSMGDCCHKMSTFYEYSSELVSNSLWVILTWVAVWLFLGLIHFVNRFITKIPGLVQYSNYFGLTTHLVLSFHIFYASLNSLYHYSIENKIDALNTTVSIGIYLLCFFIMIAVWVLTSSKSSQQNKSEQFAKKIKDLGKLENIFVKNSMDDSKSIDDDSSRNTEKAQIMSMTISSHFQKQGDAVPFTSNRVFLQKESEKNSDEDGLIEARSMAKINFFDYDYRSLYEKQRSNARFFLPITLTYLYLQSSLIVFLAPYDKLYFMISQGGLETIYLFYMIIQRPFISGFTNVRICTISLMFMSMQGIMAYYLYLQKSHEYLKLGQVILICLVGLSFILGIVFCLLEHLLSWREQIGQCVRDISKMFEFSNQNKVHDVQIDEVQKQSRNDIKVEQIQEGSSQSQYMDAFYARILKKDVINKKYRRQRKIKQNIYHAY